MRAFFLRFFLAFAFVASLAFTGPQPAFALSLGDCDSSSADYEDCVAAVYAEEEAAAAAAEEETAEVLELEDEYISGSSGSSASAQYNDISNQGIIFAGICPGEGQACPCRDSGDCSLEDALQVFVNIAYFILGISGSVLLFVFIYGGFKWLFSRGNPKWIEDGRQAIVGGVIGLTIIFGSYVAINFLIAGLTGQDSSGGNLEDTIKNGTGIDASDTIQTE